MLKKKKNNKGFTLVELLVVIAIIGILAVVAVPALFKNIEKGKVAELEADISALRSASLSYYAENSKYPVTDEFFDSTLATGGTLTEPQKSRNAVLKEVESLGFPFKGTYQLSGTEPNKALLTINVATNNNSGVNLSADAAKKLVNDLGKVLVVIADSKQYTSTGDKINESTGEIIDGDATGGDFTEIAGDVSKIIIELMSGEN